MSAITDVAPPEGPAPEAGETSGASKPQRYGAFRALRHRNYRLYFFGQLTSLAGTWMQSAAQSWLVLKLTNSSMMLGVVSFAQFTPILLVGIVCRRGDRSRRSAPDADWDPDAADAERVHLAALTFAGRVRV